MRAEIQDIIPNELPDWPHWSPRSPSDEYHWFTVAISPRGDASVDYFQVAVASPAGLRGRKRGKFTGLIVERFDPDSVEQAIRDFVTDCDGPNWDRVVDRLRTRMHCEYEGYCA